MKAIDPRLLEALGSPFSPERFRAVVDLVPRAPIWIVREIASRAVAASQAEMVRALVLDGARDPEVRAAALAGLDDASAPIDDRAIAETAAALLDSGVLWAQLHVLWWLRDHPRAEVAGAVARLLDDERVGWDMDAMWRVRNEAAVALASLPSLLPSLAAALDAFIAAERARATDGDPTDRELATVTLKALADRCAFTPA